MKKILIVYAHPTYLTSRINKALIEAVHNTSHVTIHNLYEKYPNEKIDVTYEQSLLLEHDLIVLQFPFYWFSVTPLLKKWIDEVFTFGFAYGEGGDKLQKKSLMLVVTTGGSKERYANTKGFDLPELFKPLQYTAIYCGINYLPPFVVDDATMPDAKLNEFKEQYKGFLTNLVKL